jgi:hypothetical protein
MRTSLFLRRICLAACVPCLLSVPVCAEENSEATAKPTPAGAPRTKRVRSIREGRPPMGYTIPVLDLSKENARQTIVDREKGQYLGSPSTVLLEDQRTMLVAYTKGHKAGPVLLKRSEDAGLTWSERLPTPKSWATSVDFPTLHRFADVQGKKRIVLFTGSYPARSSISGDDGKTWSELQDVGDWGGECAMASTMHLEGSNDQYMAYFWDAGGFIFGGTLRSKYGTPMGEFSGYRIYQTRTRTGGVTWEDPMEVTSLADEELCEPAAIRSPDGKEIALLMRNNSRRSNSYVVFSNDESESWGEPQELLGALTGDRHLARYAPDGRLVVTFRDTTHFSRTRGDWIAWVGRYEDLLQGREGQYRVRLMDNHWRGDCGYGGVDVLPDGTLVATGYGHWVLDESPYIVSVRFKLEELDRLAAKQAAESQKKDGKKAK